MKKTAKRRPAKKAPNKASKAIEEALGAFKAPTEGPTAQDVEFAKMIQSGQLQTEEPINDADEWTEYGPLGGQDEDAIAREVLGMEFGIQEEPVVAQEVPSELSEQAAAQAVPEPSVKSPQRASEKFYESFDAAINKNLGPAFTKEKTKACILNLIDALNFLHREGHLRKLPEKDILILKQRIKTGRQLIEKL